MTALTISQSDIPDLHGKVALVTGGSSGIGLAGAKILANRGAQVHILDINPPENSENLLPAITYHQCNVGSWVELREIFNHVGKIDFVFANAGVSEETNYFEDSFDQDGMLEEPRYGIMGVNFYGVLNTVKLAYSSMQKNSIAGSIVITTSATAYSPEHSLPVYSAAKLALVGLIRALRVTFIRSNITINGVAPAATITNLLPSHLAAPIVAQGLPVSSADFVGLALVYSATATESRRVELYGKDKDESLQQPGRWNGRVILTLGNRYTELEENTSDLRASWFGKENMRLTRAQQAATDFR
ncbi:short chain dehydrogenase reductase, partial [Periconia macrospinosa]